MRTTFNEAMAKKRQATESPSVESVRNYKKTRGMSLSRRVCHRLREVMDEQGMSQRDLSRMLGCSQGRVAKLLSGATELRLDDLETICVALDIRPVEAVRDLGLEFFAELTPTQVRLFHRLGQLDAPHMSAILLIAGLTPPAAPAAPKNPRRSRGERAQALDEQPSVAQERPA
jgi:transcriptional regulator with XRE-family HTH domain